MTAIEAAMEFLRAGSSSVAPSPELLAHVEELVQALRRGELAPSDIWAVGAMHPRSEVRLALVVEAASRNGDEDAEALIAWAVNDPDDTIAVTAAAAAARRADGGALEGLFDASGRSLAALSGARSAHADLRRRAAVDSLHHLMSSLPNGEDVRRNLAWTGYDQRQSLRGREFNTVEMVEIPAGPGAPYGFFIDTTPVTWRAYMGSSKRRKNTGRSGAIRDSHRVTITMWAEGSPASSSIGSPPIRSPESPGSTPGPMRAGGARSCLRRDSGSGPPASWTRRSFPGATHHPPLRTPDSLSLPVRHSTRPTWRN